MINLIISLKCKYKLDLIELFLKLAHHLITYNL